MRSIKILPNVISSARRNNSRILNSINGRKIMKQKGATMKRKGSNKEHLYTGI
jgi:hypothetical protein